MDSSNRNDDSTRMLIVSALKGRPYALHKLLMRFDGLLQAQVRQYLGPRRFQEEGEDILQYVRLEVVKALPGVKSREPGAVVSWLRTVVKSRLIDWERKRMARANSPDAPAVSLTGSNAIDVPASDPSPSGIYGAQEERESIRRAILAVPERYQDVLWYIYRNDPTRKEIEAFLGRGPEAARKFVSRGIDHLRRVLGVS